MTQGNDENTWKNKEPMNLFSDGIPGKRKGTKKGQTLVICWTLLLVKIDCWSPQGRRVPKQGAKSSEEQDKNRDPKGGGGTTTLLYLTIL